MAYDRQAYLIRTTREALGVSQAQFAKDFLGVDGAGAAQFVSNIERGLAPIPFTRLKFLRKCVSLNDLHRALVGDFKDGFRKHLK